MHQIPEDNAKRRLVEPDQLSAVADYMLSNGYALDDIPVQLARYYYVDLDLLNDILYRGAMPLSLPARSAAGLQQVA
ncbi:MAG: hypothetical protein JJ969_02680 [Rhizobiaceae bacterium]|nr:hypothetical protein [Rhizobiaceae bacterium]